VQRNSLDRAYDNREVREQLIPDYIVEQLPDEDEMWSLGSRTQQGWTCRGQNWGEPMRWVHRCPDIVESGLSPEPLEIMRDQLDCEFIAMFASDGETSVGSLNWHIDAYHVYAFNIEGTTEWQWFDIHEGKLKSIVIEPKKNMITMPAGVTHRVILHTPYRMSVSIIRSADIKDIAR
jgi:hypothetical protein